MEEKLTTEQMKNRLKLFYMLGESHRKQCKENGIDLDAAFEKCLDDAKDIEDPMLRFQTAMSNYQFQFIKTMPLENRCIFVLNNINKMAIDLHASESDIDWNKVNEILFTDPLQYDYNLVDHVDTVEQLSYLVSSIQQAYIFGGSWYKQKCKTCGSDFYLDKSEVDFYIKKELYIPKRCKNCIIESKGQESPRQRLKREKKEMENIQKQYLPQSGKTAMQIAYEKALEKQNKKG